MEAEGEVVGAGVLTSRGPESAGGWHSASGEALEGVTVSNMVSFQEPLNVFMKCVPCLR